MMRKLLERVESLEMLKALRQFSQQIKKVYESYIERIRDKENLREMKGLGEYLYIGEGNAKKLQMAT